LTGWLADWVDGVLVGLLNDGLIHLFIIYPFIK